MPLIEDEDLELSQSINNFVIEYYKNHQRAICSFATKIMTSNMANKKEIISELNNSLRENRLGSIEDSCKKFQ